LKVRQVIRPGAQSNDWAIPARCTRIKSKIKSQKSKIKTAEEPDKNIDSNHILILGEENFLIIEFIKFKP